MRLMLALALLPALPASDWPRFRGPEGAGVSPDRGLPAEIGREKNVLWSVAVPKGSSSPVVVGDRLILTAFEGDERIALCYSAATGAELWRKRITKAGTEVFNTAHGPVTPTPATDGRRVLVFFPEFGLLAYDRDGKELWRHPLGPFPSVPGMAASPVFGAGRAGAAWQVLSVADLGETVIATPAIAGGPLFFRTQTRLCSFAANSPPRPARRGLSVRPSLGPKDTLGDDSILRGSLSPAGTSRSAIRLRVGSEERPPRFLRCCMQQSSMEHSKARQIIILTALAASVTLAWQGGLFSVLSSTTTLGKQPSGVFLVPSNQLLAPWGAQTLIQGRPVDLAFTADRRLVAILNTKGVLLADPVTGAALGNIVSGTTSYAGVVFRPDGREIWASEVTRRGPDSLLVAELSATGAPGQTAHIALTGHPVPVGIAMSADGASAYVAFSRNNSLAVFDVATRHLKREVPVGMAPHGVAFSKLNGRVFVTNRGGRRVKPGDTLAPTSGARVASDPVTGSTVSGTVSVIDLRTFDVTELTVGLAPSGLALSPDERLLAVVNGHSDSVSIVGAVDLTVTEVKIPAMPDGTLGSQPIAAAFAPDGKTIYVACGGNNAIAVLQGAGKSWKLAGWMPTAWFPSAIGVGADGGLSVVSIKGLGNTSDGKGAYRSTAYEGSLERIPASAFSRLDAGTREVKASNQPRYTPAGGVENLPSLGIRHVFLIIKENRTYDQVFGDMPKGNNDPKLVMYGREVTPNHHALAEQFVQLDNFYATSAISFDGHHWLMQAFVSDYVQRAFAASPRGYAWDMSDALTVAPTGFFWQGARRPVDVHIWGEFCLPAKWDPATQSAVDINERSLLSWSEYWKLYQEGKWQNAVGCSAAGVPALKSIMSPRYPVNETTLPDQIRAEEFLRDLGEREKSGEMPNIGIITLTADHTNGTRFGSPTPRAMVADNDLALGRMVEGISKSRFWPKSLILVVEDDAQNGLDHVDGHRTVALAIGPNVRRGALDSNNYNQVSMIRTIQEIFQIPPRTRALKASRSMTSILTPNADATPYKCLPANLKLDEMNPPPKTLTGRARWAAEQSAAMNWHDVDDIPSDVLNRILWWDAKGYDKPYPGPEIVRAQRANAGK